MFKACRRLWAQGPATGPLSEALRAGDRRALGRALTLVESVKPEHQREAAELLSELAPYLTGRDTYRISISGPPGAGKSCFIDEIGTYLVSKGLKVAVMAVDPSSLLTGGSLLGDKTRMERLSKEDAAFVRPSPSRGTLGGVTTNSYESILLCEAAGYDVMLIETVGVGQSEVAVAELSDVFLLLLPPASGDELQGMKKGIVEVADFICITKADGDTYDSAMRSQASYAAAVRLLYGQRDSVWEPEVLAVSNTNAKSVAAVWDRLVHFKSTMQENNVFHEKRRQQRKQHLWKHLQAEIVDRLKRWPKLRNDVIRLERDVVAGLATPRSACYKIIDSCFPNMRP
eukprot:TRINITY_DN13009_c0_g1_i1.p1 TRINITY_DN13009_c0_g1~~TRINITY_DN13009_c0_g1_i1.p1  ORF type:complete len:351 (+),score=66.78 TRINITY_DN13009_c0_g1_i1:26-1054(+)